MFIDINLRKVKWILFGGYNPRKENTTDFLTKVGKAMNKYTHTYDNSLIHKLTNTL